MICLIRHGETDWNRVGRIQGKTNIPLNQTGIEQAKACQSYLAGSRWDVLITSPMLRAKQTAEIINEVLQMELEEIDVFEERGFGDAEGLTFDERNRLFPDFNYPNQESKQALEDRVMKGMQEIVERYPDKKVLLVTHGAVIHAVLRYMTQDSIDFTNTKLQNACFNHVQFLDGQWHVHNYNQITHSDK
ncbi:putative phosphoserine phosphatase 2 [Paraliobacillus ryukyuensis]|uniref:Broad-specificity phosphatase PhoE n=1 Tax=Paraliobacillus ryukyuensis TaxID=200904 RepID=A0A366DS59_9BACI|nr:histidine phosphatase family protein [Paraliobacillus ryukyuensis]RBO92309.1 broad-specificity phosphatase PhoE [Paraliobacillus ryukyuensis]